MTTETADLWAGFLKRVCICVTLLVAACGGQEPDGLLTVQAPIAGSTSIQQTFVATTRTQTPDGYGAGRSTVTHFDSYEVSIPPVHRAGLIEWGGSTPDPLKHFATVGRADFENRAIFTQALNRQMAPLAAVDREVVVFVHGYNTTFAEGLFRFAQIKHDMKLPPVTVHYAWPSTGRVRDYARDRDSALFARDGLEETLLTLVDSHADRIVVVGHSLGAFLVTETLRQIALKQRGRMRGKLAGVILVSPDIDVELFEQQLRDAAPLPQPFVVFSSPKDNALRLSGLLTGKPRLGSLTGTKNLTDLGITFIDVSAVADAGGGHLVPATSPAVLTLIKGIGQTADTLSGTVDDVFGRFKKGTNHLDGTGQLVER